MTWWSSQTSPLKVTDHTNNSKRLTPVTRLVVEEGECCVGRNS